MISPVVSIVELFLFFCSSSVVVSSFQSNDQIILATARRRQRRAPSFFINNSMKSNKKHHYSSMNSMFSIPGEGAQEDNRKSIGEEVTSIVTILCISSDYEEVKGALDKLNDLKLKVKNLQDYGAGLAISLAMKEFPEDAELQGISIGFLIDITYHMEDNMQIQTLINLGALRLCLNAMNQFPQDTTVLSNGCGVMGNLMQNGELTKQVVDAGGFQAVINAMKAHPEDPDIQEFGWFVLQRASVTSIGSNKIIKEGRIKLVVKAMLDHQDVKQLQYHGCDALYNLSKSHKVMVLDANGLEATVAAAKAHPNDSVVTDSATLALCSLWPASITTSEVESHFTISAVRPK